MCDQTEVAYLEGDVVWVKIGAIWWPGVVKDLEKEEEGRSILAGLKNKPIAVVQFFEEDNYEFVKNLEHIYHYSCRRKDEFIKKGLDKYRTGVSHMYKFPADVVKAESLTNGNINIINDPKFEPETKQNYSEIFGTAKKKKKEKDSISVGRKGQSSVAGKTTPIRAITHERFLKKALHGASDHEVRTRIQPNQSPEEESKGCFACHVCKFRSSRVNVIVAHHTLLHSEKRSVCWTSSEPIPVRKRHRQRQRKPKPINLFEVIEAQVSSDDEVLEVKKRKRKETVTSMPKRSAPVEEPKPVEDKKQFAEDLLADWMEEDDDEDSKKCETFNVEEKQAEPEKLDEEETLPLEKKQENEKSCFDFDEEEEGFIGMSNANTYGRKIPRVIPVKDKSDLGLDLEVEELFKKKVDASDDQVEPQSDTEPVKEKDLTEDELEVNPDTKEEVETKPVVKRGRKKKQKPEAVHGEPVEEMEKKVVVTSTLASTRARRPGSKKSYLNEVIERIDDDVEPAAGPASEPPRTPPPLADIEVKKPTSRRKQELKTTSLSDDRDNVYADMIESSEQNKEEVKVKKPRGRKRKESVADTSRAIKDSKTETTDEAGEDLSSQINSLLAETSVPTIPSPSKIRKDTVLSPERISSPPMVLGAEDGKDNDATGTEIQEDTTKIRVHTTIKQPTSIVVKSPEVPEASGTKVAVIKSATGASKKSACLVLPMGKKLDLKKMVLKSGGEKSLPGVSSLSVSGGVVKTIQLRAPSESVLATTKLKGQTILQDSEGRYVIVKPQPAGRQATVVSSKKPGFGNKVMIVRNQKIIKMDGGRVVSSSDLSDSAQAGSSSSGLSQHVIKLIPERGGNVLKTVSVPHKKVILQGGSKLIVSTSSTSSSSGQGSSGQDLSSGVKEDVRYITNLKGARRTLLIQSPSSDGTNIVLKQAGSPRQTLSKMLQAQPASSSILSLKNNPKIMMRSTGQGQSKFVVAPSVGETSTFVMKRKGADGKYTSPKIIRKVPVRQVATTASSSLQLVHATMDTGQKTLILAPGGHVTTQSKALPGKILRWTPKAPDVRPKVLQRPVTKSSELYHTTAVAETPTTSGDQPATVLQTQVMAMPGPVGADGNPTYVLLTVDEHGFAQPMDNSLISYNTTEQQQQGQVGDSSSNVILMNAPHEDVTVYSAPAGQDILAEALANTNVLEGSVAAEIEPLIPTVLLPPSIPPSVVQETSITLQKPIMTPLEMPSSVAPDTSCLEPPPLPPTPTEEDVLMEERDGELMIAENQEGRPLDITDDQVYEEQVLEESQEEVNHMDGQEEAEKEENSVLQEEFVIEDSQEDQETNSFQSMPLLNDEPDTSDDVPIENQDFESQRSRLETKGYVATEPPTSTNGDFIAEYQDIKTVNRDFDSSSQDEPGVEEETGEQKESQESQHLDLLPASDDDHVASYEVDPSFPDVISEKRFQEETEVTSTTDEYTTRPGVM